MKVKGTLWLSQKFSEVISALGGYVLLKIILIQNVSVTLHFSLFSNNGQEKFSLEHACLCHVC